MRDDSAVLIHSRSVLHSFSHWCLIETGQSKHFCHERGQSFVAQVHPRAGSLIIKHRLRIKLDQLPACTTTPPPPFSQTVNNCTRPLSGGISVGVHIEPRCSFSQSYSKHFPEALRGAFEKGSLRHSPKNKQTNKQIGRAHV